ncbi:SWIM zinc finger family protein [Paenibacillus sp. D2_2]|uniref:SWIM zinc finger family protein n=1 Tax=Paenibacillus sp. D2_2 TaxID=3073092 RepID=UPI0028160879|nr:SWIM zinc finger family protein [Paenibacillus sp. D2_2]WMT38867.1 SWIM zinc finger family protein [Paenibacillus sp. D2_2]
MRHLLTQSAIHMFCGKAAYETGRAYYEAGKVNYTRQNTDQQIYKAIVSGTDEYEVNLTIYSDGALTTDCTCPAFAASGNYCPHIAAVMIGVYELQNHPKPSAAHVMERKETIVNQAAKLERDLPPAPIAARPRKRG